MQKLGQGNIILKMYELKLFLCKIFFKNSLTILILLSNVFTVRSIFYHIHTRLCTPSSTTESWPALCMALPISKWAFISQYYIKRIVKAKTLLKKTKPFPCNMAIPGCRNYALHESRGWFKSQVWSADHSLQGLKYGYTRIRAT